MSDTALMKIGDRVQMTEKALEKKLDGADHRRTGIYKRMSASGTMRVQRDGNQSFDYWHPDFWEPETAS